MGILASIKRSHIALVAGVAALVALVGIFLQSDAPAIKALLGKSDKGDALASATQCSLNEEDKLKDEIYFVSCGGFF